MVPRHVVSQPGPVEEASVAHLASEWPLAVWRVDVDPVDPQTLSVSKALAALLAHGRRLGVGLLEVPVGALAALRHVGTQAALHGGVQADAVGPGVEGTGKRSSANVTWDVSFFS